MKAAKSWHFFKTLAFLLTFKIRVQCKYWGLIYYYTDQFSLYKSKTIRRIGKNQHGVPHKAFVGNLQWWKSCRLWCRKGIFKARTLVRNASILVLLRVATINHRFDLLCLHFFTWKMAPKPNEKISGKSSQGVTTRRVKIELLQETFFLSFSFLLTMKSRR